MPQTVPQTVLEKGSYGTREEAASSYPSFVEASLHPQWHCTHRTARAFLVLARSLSFLYAACHIGIQAAVTLRLAHALWPQQGRIPFFTAAMSLQHNVRIARMPLVEMRLLGSAGDVITRRVRCRALEIAKVYGNVTSGRAAASLPNRHMPSSSTYPTR